MRTTLRRMMSALLKLGMFKTSILHNYKQGVINMLDIVVPCYLVKKRKQHTSNLTSLESWRPLDFDGELRATYCGVVERIDRLVLVRSLKSRYTPETGNIVVGRVVEVAQKRWKIDVNAYHDVFLMLSSVTLPDGIQRRRTAVDELSGIYFRRMMSSLLKLGMFKTSILHNYKQGVTNMGSSIKAK